MTIRPTAAGAAGAFVLAALIPATAAASRVDGKVAAPPGQIRPVAAVERADEAACSRARRRLWVAGEGWVVRRITTCR